MFCTLAATAATSSHSGISLPLVFGTRLRQIAIKALQFLSCRPFASSFVSSFSSFSLPAPRQRQSASLDMHRGGERALPTRGGARGSSEGRTGWQSCFRVVNFELI